ncbi:MAG: adenylosuccinate lyase [Nitrospirae bacterium]|nr:adenylosuccinate lyase [Nitrospirota bacterium]
MIKRYSLPEMTSLWTEEKKYEVWFQIELLACEAMAELGIAARSDIENIRSGAKVDLKRITEIEEVVKHDVIAFITAISEKIGPSSRFLHLGMTSSDVVDTGQAILLNRACGILLEDLTGLMAAVKKKALQFKHTQMIGRSHGVHGEPITFGFKLALWHEELKRSKDRLEEAKEVIRVGKISGSMGTFAHVDPFVEKYVCEKLGLIPDPISNQIIQRDRHAQLLTTLAILASSLEKFSLEIRHLQRTEVREAEEFFSEGQKGSSSMPHKRNPIGSENISGLARLIRSNAMASLENIPLWHERDISHSSVERVIFPDTTILMNYILNRFTKIVENLSVFPEKMKENLNLTHGIIYSQRILLELAKKGEQRKEAYEIVQKLAMESWQNGRSFEELLLNDSSILSYISLKDLKSCFDPKYYVRHMDEIFKRVFDKE